MRRVLVLGADGFIGRHIAFALRARGWQVLASARRTGRLEAMGFEVLAADLTRPETHDPAFWAPYLEGRDLVNAAGLLTGSARAFEAVHVLAPRAAYAALGAGRRGVLISAVGIDTAPTPFARWRRAGERVAPGHVTILRPGLVLGDTSYGGSSLLRALAALPFRTPVIGDGNQPFDPLHAADLALLAEACLADPPGHGPFEAGGPERVSQREMLTALRGWLGLAPVPVLRLPLRLARWLGRLGDALRIGPVSATAVAQLEAGVAADGRALSEKTGLRPRPFRAFLAARPAGTQDLWHARLYLMRPLLRLVLALLWLASGLLGLWLAPETFLPLIPAGLPEPALVALARLGGLADLAIAAALLRGWRPRLMAGVQAGMVATYTLAFSLLAPALWLLPLGGLLKNLPLLALIAVAAILEDER